MAHYGIGAGHCKVIDNLGMTGIPVIDRRDYLRDLRKGFRNHYIIVIGIVVHHSFSQVGRSQASLIFKTILKESNRCKLFSFGFEQLHVIFYP